MLVISKEYLRPVIANVIPLRSLGGGAWRLLVRILSIEEFLVRKQTSKPNDFRNKRETAIGIYLYLIKYASPEFGDCLSFISGTYGRAEAC
jgi:hypothetical protein